MAPVYTIEELVQDPHLNARGAFGEAQDAEHGTFRQLAPALAGMSRSRDAVPVRDAQQTDTEMLLEEAGMDSGEIARLIENAVIA